VQLDSATDRRRLEVEQQRLLSLQPQVVALTRELAATEEAARQAARTTTVLLDQHRSREVAAEVAARVSGEEAKRLAELHGQGAAPLMEVQRTRVEAESRKANLAVEGLESRRLLSEQLGREGQTRAHQEELRRELALLQGTVATTTATIRVLEEELLKLEVRAPVDGEVAHVTPLTVGSVVQAGHAVARIVPQGDLVVIAEFEPGQALGRVREGQPARMRLDAFPWTQFGSLPVHVRTVASETAQARGGRVRVEFAIDADAPSVLPLQHGLPGSVEVALEEVSPWVLMLRATGEFLRADTRSTPAPLEAPRLEQH
jgi:multidrug resistance efflux pump